MVEIYVCICILIFGYVLKQNENGDGNALVAFNERI